MSAEKPQDNFIETTEEIVEENPVMVATEEVEDFVDVEKHHKKDKTEKSKKKESIFNKIYNIFCSIGAKIIIPYLLSAIIISGIGAYLLFVSTNSMAQETISVKLINTLEMFFDYKITYVDDTHPWEMNDDLFSLYWLEDEYTLEFLHKSDFGFAIFEYDASTGTFELTNDLDSGVAKIINEDADLLSKENSKELYENCNFYYITSKEKDGVINKYYWWFVAQDEASVKPGDSRKAFAIVYNETESADAVKIYITRVVLYMLFPAFVFTVIIGLIIGKFTRRIHKVSNYISEIDLNDLPEEPLNLHSYDELHEMANSVNTMVSGLKERERMSHELSTAATIQSNMLIKDFPAFPDRHDFDIFAAMTPAKEVGGDFYDMYMIDDKRLAIVIGDVSDKGVPAALFMTMTKSLIKYHLPVGDTDEVLTKVNKFLYDGNENFMFVTCFIGIINLETGEFEYASAGHNPPAIKLGKDGKYEFLEVDRDVVLGIMPGVVYRSRKITIPHGSKIILYTDGVTEAINEKKEQFEEHRLIECLEANDKNTVTEVLHAINESIVEFRGSEAQFDDITMLMVEYY